MALLIERSEMDLLFSMLLPCSHIFYIKATEHWDTMVLPDCTVSLKDTIIGKCHFNTVTNMYAYVQNANK